MSLRMRLKARKNRARVAIATELLRRPDAKHYGYKLYQQTGVGPGTIYPYLTKLEKAGFVQDGWEDPSDTGGRPPRRYYRLTAAGVEALSRFIDEQRLRDSSG